MTDANRTRVPAPRAPRGFTLIELLVVVAILGIMASMAMISSTDDDVLALDLAGMQIGDAVDRAHALALSNRTAYGVTFDVSSDRFAVVDEFGKVIRHPVSKKDWIVDFVTPGQPERIDIVSASFGDGGASILFDAAGEPVASGTLKLSRDGSALTLTFDAISGRLE